jgi:hypothetical protein
MNKIAGFKEDCENVPLFVPLVKRLPLSYYHCPLADTVIA